MTLATRLNLACVITPRTVEADDEGETEPTDGTPVELDGGDDGGCYAEQRGASEGTDRANRQTQEWLVLLRPPTLTVSGLDMIEIPDLSLSLEVVGPPNQAYNPRTRSVSHLECVGREVTS